mmetsp:Transcript_19168/g.48063  ORF Transcript_19168/g.48063 Transcript_19168/m.48063 type:complete len:135 (+) Transcript_19168:52-456(+)
MRDRSMCGEATYSFLGPDSKLHLLQPFTFCSQFFMSHPLFLIQHALKSIFTSQPQHLCLRPILPPSHMRQAQVGGRQRAVKRTKKECGEVCNDDDGVEDVFGEWFEHVIGEWQGRAAHFGSRGKVLGRIMGSVN